MRGRRRPPNRRRRVYPSVVRLVTERDGWACVVCSVNVYGGQRGVDWSLHHRRPAGMGGSKLPGAHGPANLLTVCGHGTAGDHGRIESDRAWAYSVGLLVPSYGDPFNTPVLIHGDRWVHLTADGEYADAPPSETA